MASLHFQTLRSQLIALRAALLPRNLKVDILELPPRVSARALAYRVLVHAELENYFESRSLEIGSAVAKRWKDKRDVSVPAMHMLGFSGLHLKNLPDTFDAPDANKKIHWETLVKIDSRLSQAITSYYYYVSKQNHGIREENLVRMLLPIGFNRSVIDDFTLAELNSFAGKRGSAAHQSCAGQLSIGVNPRDEYLAVSRIVEAIKPIDIELSRLLAEAA